MLLIALGTALIVLGIAALGEEWRRTQMRVELLLMAAAMIGCGVAVSYAGAT